MTPNELITRFRRRYSQCDQAAALELLNDVDEEILFHLPLRVATRPVALVAWQTHYDLQESEIRLWSARYIRTGAQGDQIILAETSTDELNRSQPAWRDSAAGTPSQFATEVQMGLTSSTGKLVLNPAPNITSLTVLGATNASPIVITTQTHGLVDGDVVLIQGVNGNTAANGRYHAKITGYSGTTFAIYFDVLLAQPRGGNGAFTSGGAIAAKTSPMVLLDATKRISYSGTEELPLTPMLRDLYVDGMCKQFAKERDRGAYGYWEQVFSKRLADQQLMVHSRAAGVRPEILPPVAQRPYWR